MSQRIVFDLAVELGRSSVHFGKWSSFELYLITKNYGYLQFLLMNFLRPVSQLMSFCIKQQITGFPNMKGACFGLIKGKNIQWSLNDGPQLDAKDASAKSLNNSDLFA